MSELPCSTVCDYPACQELIDCYETHPTVSVGLTVLYWGKNCNDWHTMIVNSIGSTYPSHYSHFDRQTPLTRSYSSRGYYMMANTINVPHPSPPGNHSAYIFCYVPQNTLLNNDINRGLTTTVLQNVGQWYGAVILFATDLMNRV